jgi:allantoinase
MAETMIRGGTIVTPEGTRVADVRIEGEQIAEIGPELRAGRHEPARRREIDARGLHVLPGGIDVHVHFNEPGRTEWEGAATGSRALAAGGGTTFFDMPLNSTPCTVNVREFDRKRAALEAASVADFALWGGLVPGAVPEMAEMAARGVVGFKAFMCDSGLPEFPRADDLTLFDGMREATRLRLPVAVHAESHELTSALAARMTGRGWRDFIDARPVVAELEAIQRAVFFAGETAASLHLVHVSSGRGVALAAEAKARGVDVSIETCGHYLYFTEDDVERLGAVAKCAPPLRSSAERERLWSELAAGHIDIVASDHSPTEPSMKRGDFVGAWGGIAGVQSTLAVLLECGWYERAIPLERIARLLAAEPARRFRLTRKGAVTPGADADITLVDVASVFTLREPDLQQRHPMTPYLGARFRGIVRRTLRRGETIFEDGAITATGRGQLVRPSRA